MNQSLLLKVVAQFDDSLSEEAPSFTYVRVTGGSLEDLCTVENKSCIPENKSCTVGFLSLCHFVPSLALVGFLHDPGPKQRSFCELHNTHNYHALMH